MLMFRCVKSEMTAQQLQGCHKCISIATVTLVTVKIHINNVKTMSDQSDVHNKDTLMNNETPINN